MSNHAIKLSTKEADLIIYEKVYFYEEYRIEFVKEIMDVKAGGLEVEGFDEEGLYTILDYLCTS